MQHTAARAIVTAKNEELQRRLESVLEQNKAADREFEGKDEEWQKFTKFALDERMAAAQVAVDKAQEQVDICVQNKYPQKAEDANKKIKKILKSK